MYRAVLTATGPDGMMPPREGPPMDRRESRLSRRQFVLSTGGVGLGLLAGCARLPFQSMAQPPARVPRIGYFSSASTDDRPALANPEALRQGLCELGYVEGENIAFEWRFTEGNLDRL